MAETVRALRERILAQARVAPAPGAVPLVVARQCCGSVARDVAELLDAARVGLRLHDGMLEAGDAALDFAGRTAVLNEAAVALLRAGRVPAWRNEQLEVRPAPDAAPVACVDRCAVRVLGITTYSVHLNGFTADGSLVVGRRAAGKRVDPGLWDNLAGGMIAAGEQAEPALEREAFEEAGLHIAAMPLVAGARIAVRRPIAEGTLAEVVHVFDVTLPAGTEPVNQDGEVERFETWPVDEVLRAIARGAFTVEAALATLDALQRRGYADAPALR